jgi:hypothetical protein
VLLEKVSKNQKSFPLRTMKKQVTRDLEVFKKKVKLMNLK